MLALHKTHVPHRVFLKMNSGMNRLGFKPSAYRSAWTRLNALPQVDEISLVTHFSDADSQRLGTDGVAHQIDAFAAATQDLPGERSLCNSAATLRHASRALGQGRLAADWVRGGIALYGGAPDHPEHRSADWELQPAMTLASRLIAIQQLQPGDTVGYGSTYTARQPMRIGIAACGYADGYPRHAPGGRDQGAPVLVRGVRSRLVGRVSMDMLAVDLGPAEAAGQPCRIGDEVVLWGRSRHGAVLPVDEVAQAAGTIAYELLCAVAPRVPFVLEEGEAGPAPAAGQDPAGCSG